MVYSLKETVETNIMYTIDRETAAIGKGLQTYMTSEWQPVAAQWIIMLVGLPFAIKA